MSQVVIKPSSLSVPNRQQLLQQIASANRFDIVLAIVQSVCALFLAFLIDWRRAIAEPWVTTVAIGAVVGPFAMELLRFWAVKKKRIEDLQEKTRFGEFDKHLLSKLYQETLQRLRLPDDKLPVYIIADKSMNGFMMHAGLGWLFNSLNGIYLNRQVLHKLNSAEVQSLMGHELAHYYRHYLLSDRLHFLTLTLGALLGLFVTQWLGMEGFFSLIALLVCANVFWYIASFQRAKHSMAIEYLCDDFGAQVRGVTTSITELMKIGVEVEVLTAVQQQALLSASRGKLSTLEIVDAISAALPYGHATQEELEKAVEKQLKQRAQQGATLGGFLRYLWQSDVDAEAGELIEKEMRRLKKLESIPRVPWEKLLSDPHQMQFTEESMSRLMELMEANPDAELFPTADALGQTAGTHPPLKLRILYLWQNRRAIEQAALNN